MKKLKKKLNIIFAGTSEFSKKYLEALIYNSYNINCIITKTDKPVGRGKKITPPPVKIIAKKYNIPIIQTNIFNEKIYKIIKKKKTDIMIVVSYGILIPEIILKSFQFGCINIHTSLLPKWRGSSPIQSVILNGEYMTGISVIYMNKKMDSGNIIQQNSCLIHLKDTYDSLYKKLCKIGIHSMLIALKKIIYKSYQSIPQDESQATYCKKIKKKMGQINFLYTADKIEKMTRAFYPWPGTYIIIKNKNIKINKVKIIKKKKKYSIGQIIKINKNGIQVQTSKNIINILKIQLPGKKSIQVSEFINSSQKIFFIGDIIK